jgi:hypothetical protein
VNSWSSDSSRIPHEIQVRDGMVRNLDANGATPSRFLEFLDIATTENLWRKLPDRSGVLFSSFLEFIEAPHPYGLGLAGKADLLKVISRQHKEEREPYYKTEVAERMAEMRQRVGELLGEEVPEERGHGGDRRSGEFQPGGTRLKKNDHNTADEFLARLKRDDPELAEKVIHGKVTPNAAALQMGWRKQRILVTKPQLMVKHLREHMSREDQLELAALLMIDQRNYQA